MEYKGEDVFGPARIGRVTFNKTGKSVFYKGRRFTVLSRKGLKANYYDAETRDHYWISGCKKDGTDALYSTIVEVDEDVREEYWARIRNKPEMKTVASFKCEGKYSK
jgi:hypothetical protein